jgi:integrase
MALPFLCQPGTQAEMNPANMLKRVFSPVLRRAGLPRIRFHDLRHVNASLRIEAGQNLKYLQGQLGHSSIQVTLDVYGHLLRDTDQQAAIKLRGIALGGKW